MNEAETRAELIDPKIKDSGWGVIEDTKVLREHHITIGKIQTGGGRSKPLIADYVLTCKNQKLAVVEAKSDELPVGEGVAQAKNYAGKLNIPFAYFSNGNEIYEINMKTDAEKDVACFPTPDELWQRIFVEQNDWREIMKYFSPAVQLGLTATPKRNHNIDTYNYFGEPVYIYSLKEGINDGFLTLFKVKRIKTTIDEYVYTPDDTVIEGEVEEGRIYVETDFNRIIEIKVREKKRVKIVLSEINQKEKTIIFCATQDHALAIRDLVNQLKESYDTNYCQRVTANDGALGEQHLRDFQDNERTIPTVLTTSQKLSTGVDARNIRNIVLLRPINTMIEFKQIVGRGTRLFDSKEYFTIYDFVDAYHHFSDPEWDGEPEEPEPCSRCGQYPCLCESEPPQPCKVCGQIPCVCENEPPQLCPKCGQSPCICKRKIKIKLRDGKEREIQYMIATLFYNTDGKPISAEEFLENLYGKLPSLLELKYHSITDAVEELGGKDKIRNTFIEFQKYLYIAKAA